MTSFPSGVFACVPPRVVSTRDKNTADRGCVVGKTGGDEELKKNNSAFWLVVPRGKRINHSSGGG